MENEKYKMIFSLYNPQTGFTTKVEKEFDQWLDTEFETVFKEISYCLMACGYSEKLVDDYFGEL